MSFLGHDTNYHTEHDIIETKRKDEAGELRRFSTTPCLAQSVWGSTFGNRRTSKVRLGETFGEEEEGHTLLDLHQIACGPVGLA